MVPQHIAAVATALTNQAETKQTNKEYFSPAVITPIHAIKTALARTIMVVWVAATVKHQILLTLDTRSNVH